MPAVSLTLAALGVAASLQASPTPSPAPAPVITPAPSAASVPASATIAPEPDRICRRQPISGSRRVERVCHTRAEWDALRENARTNRDTASRTQRSGF